MGRQTRKARDRRHHPSKQRAPHRKPLPGRPLAAPLKGSSERALIGYLSMALASSLAIMLITTLDPLTSWLIGVNTVTLIAFSFDKSAARRNEWRIPELTLFALAATGGSPMAWLARSVLGHKTAKATFGRTLGTITALQIALGIGAAFYLRR